MRCERDRLHVEGNMPKNEEMTEAHIRAAELHFQGRTQAQIAEAIGVNPSTVYRWIRDGKLAPLIAAMSEDLQKTVRARLIRSSLRAADAAVEVLDSEDDGRKLAAAFGILDRTGHPKSERVELAGKVETGGRVTVDPSEELASLLSGGEG